MTTWFKKLILFVALSVLPLQGMAMATTFVKCHEQAATQAGLHGQDHHEHDGDSTNHHHHGSDEGAPGSFSSHLCGHHFALHVPTTADVAFAPAFAAWSLPDLLSYTPYFPEHPRRPPRA